MSDPQHRGISQRIRSRVLVLDEGEVISWRRIKDEDWEEVRPAKNKRQTVRYVLSRLAQEGFLEQSDRAGPGTYRRTPKEHLKEDIYRSGVLRHASMVVERLGNPDMILEANVPVYAFGALFVILGGDGYLLPTSHFVTVGVESDGSGEIEWLSRTSWKRKPPGRGRENMALAVTGRAAIRNKYQEVFGDRGPFGSEEEFQGYFEKLGTYNWTVAWDSGVGHGLSAAGVIAAIMATVAMTEENNRVPHVGRLSAGVPSSAWLVNSPSKPMKLNECFLLTEKPYGWQTAFRKYLRLCQAFERIWNTGNETEAETMNKVWQGMIELVKGDSQNLAIREYSSAGSSLCATLASPVKVILASNGEMDMNRSTAYPRVSANAPLCLIINGKGAPEATHEVLHKTLERYRELIEFAPVESIDIIRAFANTSSIASRLASEIVASMSTGKKRSPRERKMLATCMHIQRGLYMQMGTPSPDFHLLYPWAHSNQVDISPTGLGAGGTFLACASRKTRVDATLRDIRKKKLRTPSELKLDLLRPVVGVSIYGTNVHPFDGIPLSLYKVDM